MSSLCRLFNAGTVLCTKSTQPMSCKRRPVNRWQSVKDDAFMRIQDNFTQYAHSVGSGHIETVAH